jgi:enoyl-CoA hydratase/carnithine racemase
MPYSDIRYDVADRVATITLHRPAKLNAFTTAMRDELIEALGRADADDEVRAVIVTGAGRAFCAGADLSAGASTFAYRKRGDLPPEERRDGGGRVSLRIFEMKKPVIAAVNGAAVGVGVTMTLPMDIRIASTEARFGFVFARQMLWRMLGADHPMEAHKVDSRGIFALGASPDVAEGVTAFKEKRAPRFGMKPSRDMPDFYPWWEERPFK